MILVFRTRDLLSDLFPGLADASPEDIKRRLEAHYGKVGATPHVVVDPDVVTVEFDRALEDAFSRDLDRATSLATAGKYRQAKRLLESLIERHPSVSDLHRMYGQALFEEGDGEAAVDHLIEALRWDPENKHALVLMGNIQFRTFRDVATATRYYERAAALDPDDHLTLNNLGAAMLEAGRFAEGRRYFSAAKDVAPDYPNTHLGMALSFAHEGDMLGAFENAVTALKLADVRDPVRQAALDAAIKAAGSYAQQTLPADLYGDYAREVETTAGKPVEVQAATDISTLAKLEVAEVRGRDRHLIKYRRDGTGVAHLIAHELGHLALIAEARAAGTNKLFTTNEARRRRFVDDHLRDVQKFVRDGIPGAQATEIMGQLVDGLNSQIYNAPIDLFIEAELHRRQPALRPVQFVSLYRMLSDYTQSAQSKEIRRMTPRRVFEANVVYNLTHALQFRDLYGVDLTSGFGGDRRLLREAERLYDEFVAIRDERRPGEEYELVYDWASDLGVDGYFELVDERPTPQATEPASRTPEDVMAEVEDDPLGLTAPERTENRSTFNIKGSPAASMAVTMYLLDALKLFEGRDRAFVESVAFEVAMLGNYGLNADDPEKKYRLQAVPGKSFSALHLLAYMYAGFMEVDPSLDTELDFADEYAMAKAMHGGG